MQLNGTIARQIVERAMKIIHHSVNVMDEYGRIIGSGDPSRLNERHEGAILAINDNRVVEIDHATAQQLKGVKPGINLPIRFQQQTIGVVGVSGDPALVRSYGELVKMTAELIVEQEALMSQIQWNKRHREELVLQLIRGSELNEAQLLSVGQKLGLDLNQPRVAAIIQVLPKTGTTLSLEHLQRMVHLLEYPERNNLVGITSVANNEIVVLKPITLSKGRFAWEREQQRLDQLLKQVEKEHHFSIKIALGEYFEGLTGLARSYQIAQATLQSATGNEKVLFYRNHILPVLLGGISQDSWRHEQLKAPLVQLHQSDPRGLLVRTLEAYFQYNCDLSQVCEALHIHRNTLRYRLARIEAETGLSFSNISDKTRLYLAISC